MPIASPWAVPDAGASAEAAAVIAEARARARRRRRKTALAAIIGAAAVAGGLMAARVFTGSPPASGIGPRRPAPLAARAGRVTGYIDACLGIYFPGAPRYAAGTVTALRGRETWRNIGDGDSLPQLPPAATATAARRHVAAGQAFSFDLTAGQYALVARYDDGNGRNIVNVTVTAGQVLHLDFPDICK
jgi:hypothetical protein